MTNLAKYQHRLPSEDEDSGLYVYLPPEALQGEQVPAFAKWKIEVFQKIEVEFSEGLTLKEVFNVSKSDWILEGNKLAIAKPEVNGYLGLIFDSTRLPAVRKKADLLVRFYSDQETFKQRQLEIELYRPLLEFDYSVKKLVVDPRRPNFGVPLSISKKGDGTVLCWVEHMEGSEVTVEASEAVSQFRNGLAKDLKISFEQIAERFPKFAALLKKVQSYLSEYPDFESPKWAKELQSFIAQLRDAMETEADFRKLFSETLAEALLKNLHLINYFEQLKDYLLSIRTKKILLQNPADALKFHKGKSFAKLRIGYTDLTLEYYPAVEIELDVHAEDRGELPIYRLLEWQ